MPSHAGLAVRACACFTMPFCDGINCYPQLHHIGLMVMYMSVVTSLLSKLEFTGGIKLRILKLETTLASVRYSTPRLNVDVARAWNAQHSAEEFQRGELARRTFNEAEIRIIANR